MDELGKGLGMGKRGSLEGGKEEGELWNKVNINIF